MSSSLGIALNRGWSLNKAAITRYRIHLESRELAPGTIHPYVRHSGQTVNWPIRRFPVTAFTQSVGSGPVAIDWRADDWKLAAQRGSMMPLATVAVFVTLTSLAIAQDHPPGAVVNL